MNTTEFVVEQVLTGLLVLAVVALAIPIEEAPEGWDELVSGAAVLTVAYLVGVLFDRFADTLLSREEQIQRLKVANERIERSKKPNPHERLDPFPENALRIRVLKASDSLDSWVNYLRTRIRIVRSIAVFLPAITLVGASRLVASVDLRIPWVVATVCAFVYGVVFLATLRLQIEGHPRRMKRTHDPEIESFVEAFTRRREPVSVGIHALGLAGLGLLLIAAAAGSCELMAVAGVLTAGALLSALAAWSWRRITKTLMTFLADCDDFLDGGPGSPQPPLQRGVSASGEAPAST